MARPKKKEVIEQEEGVVSTLFGKIKQAPVEIEVEKKFNLFDFVNDINLAKQYLYSDETASAYEPFTINRAMTIFPDTFCAGEFLNSNHHLDKKMQHDYLFYSVQSRKRFKKGGWLKKSEEEKAEHKILKDVGKYLQLNIVRTRQFWTMLTDQQKKDFLAKYIYVDAANSKLVKK